MKYGLSDQTINDLQNVFRSFENIETVILYGSRAKGNFHEGSDIDFAVTGKNIDLSLLHEIELKIDTLFLPYRIDLCNFEDIENNALKDHIKRVGKYFYQA